MLALLSTSSLPFDDTSSLFRMGCLGTAALLGSTNAAALTAPALGLVVLEDTSAAFLPFGFFTDLPVGAIAALAAGS